ncbi:MAG: VWA domain-containing protein [Pseudomonadales bacterium]
MLIENFHFLRPEWLLAAVPAAGILYLCWRRQLHGSSWHKVIDPALLQHLLQGEQSKRERWPLYALAIAMLIAILALAGPAWQRLPQPVAQTQNALLIVLDLSLSMRAADIAPSRIERARLKLRDVLMNRKEGLTALIVFAGDAHAVAPFTDDAKTIEAMLPALEPEIMPKLGSRPELALELGRQLLTDAKLNTARVLLVSDDIRNEQIAAMRDAIGQDLELAIMSVGTAEGGPIPLPQGGFLKDNRGEIVVAQVKESRFREAASELGAPYRSMTSDGSDLTQLLPDKIAALSELRETEREFDVWRDEGALLVLLLLPLALLAFRRGLIVPVLLISILPLPADASEPGENSELSEASNGDQAFKLGEAWDSLWQTKDQRAQTALNNGDAAAASELFEQPDWKASAAYKAENYEAAAELFDAQSHYNRGNALAKGGKLDEAIEAYDAALRRDPANEDAQFNKELVEKLKQQQEQQQDQDQNQDEQQQGDQENKDQQNQDGEKQDQQENQQNSDQQDQSQDSQQNDSESDSSQDQEQQDKEQQESEQQDQEQQQEEPDEPQKPEQSESEQQAEQAAAEEGKSSDERQQELEQWLRKVPDDPGGLLRNKFRYQYEQNRRKREHYDKDGQLY